MAGSVLAPDAIASPARRPVSRRLLFAFLVLLGLAVFQELVFRLTFPLPEVPSFNRTHYMIPGLPDDPLLRLGDQGLHNVTIRWESAPDGAAFLQHLNLYGFRGPTFPIDRTRHRRVLFVGDSYVEGVGAADDETISEQFAAMLGRRVEAINLGVSGVSYPEYTRLVRDGVSLLRPDAVFLVTCCNDLPALPLEPEDREPAKPFARANRWVPRVVPLADRLRAGQPVPRVYSTGPYPYFAAVPSLSNPLTWLRPCMKDRPDKPKWMGKTMPENLDPALREAMSQGRFNPWMLRAVQWLHTTLSHDYRKWGGAWDHLALMAYLCREQGARFYLVYIPCNAAVHPDHLAAQKHMGGDDLDAITTLSDPAHRRQQEHLHITCQSLAIPFLDLTDDFIRLEAAGTRAFWSYDGHCTGAGYRLIADRCAGLWREERHH